MSLLEDFIDLRLSGLEAREALEIMATFEPCAVEALRLLDHGRPLGAALRQIGWIPREGRAFSVADLEDPATLRLIALRAARRADRGKIALNALWLPLMVGGSSLLGLALMSTLMGGGGALWPSLGLLALLGVAFAMARPQLTGRLCPFSTREARLEAGMLLPLGEEGMEALRRHGHPEVRHRLKIAARGGLRSLGEAPPTRPLARALTLGAQLEDTPSRLARLVKTEAGAIRARMRLSLQALAWSWVLWVAFSGAHGMIDQGMRGLEGLQGLEQLEQEPEVRELMRGLGL